MVIYMTFVEPAFEVFLHCTVKCINTILGSYQNITIDKVSSSEGQSFYVTNRSQRPIPIRSMNIQFRDKDCQGRWKKWQNIGNELTLKDYTMPDTLAPEHAARIEFSLRNTLGTSMFEAFQIIVTTQTGKQIKKHFKGGGHCREFLSQ